MGEQPETGTYDAVLDAALALFATKGFEATGVRQIAERVGIKAPSLYKHFASKQAILNALVTRELAAHAQVARGLGMPEPIEGDAQAYARASVAFMQDTAVGLLDHWCSGSAALFRRMLGAESARSPEMAQLYRRLFLDAPLTYQTALFERLMALGAFKPGDPAATALQFWAPLLALMQLGDCGVELPELDRRARDHIALFARLHVVREEPHE